MPTQLQKHEGRFYELKTVRMKKFYGILERREKFMAGTEVQERVSQYVVDVEAKYPSEARRMLIETAKIYGSKLLNVYAYQQ